MRKERLSNIELLRIVAMLLVLVIHSDFSALGHPGPIDFEANPTGTIARLFFAALSICCVNVFVLISGWFGIRPSVKGFCNFIFQCLFFIWGIYAVLLLTGNAHLSVRGIAECLLMSDNDWFVKSYIGLYILSPILNLFVEQAPRKTFKMVLIAFFAFQTTYGWVSHGAEFFEGGFSTISFAGLYLLARYVKVYRPKLTNYPPLFYVICYFGMAILMVVIGVVALPYDGPLTPLFSYTNPLVILSALSLLLCFDGIKFKSRAVNWVAASSFAIYLVHVNPNIFQYHYLPLVRQIYNAHSGVDCLLVISGLMVAVSVASVLVDQVRKLIWAKGVCRICRWQ